MLINANNSKKKFFWIINIIFLLEWIFLAFNVDDRETWVLENSLVLILVPIAINSFIKNYISRTSYLLIFIFTSFHIIGAHYTYSLVPYNIWSENILGQSLNSILGWDRNNYDRIIHFFWGVFLFLPLRELVSNTMNLHKARASVFAALIIVATSTIYEIVEYGAAVIFSGDLGLAYTGAQGDVWDSQKDQLLAIFGIGIALGFSKITVLKNIKIS